jgi:hypothetical protein
MEGSQKAQNDELKHHKEKLEKKEQIRKTLLLFKSMLNDKKLSEIEIENNENLEVFFVLNILYCKSNQ